MFWERVEALAAKEHITIKNMLIDLNMSLGSFSNWKKRGNIPSGEAVSKIAKYFNVSTDYLLEIPISRPLHPWMSKWTGLNLLCSGKSKT